jgi:hypothetical protein
VQEHAAAAGAAVRREQRDVHDPDLVRGRHIERALCEVMWACLRSVSK